MTKYILIMSAACAFSSVARGEAVASGVSTAVSSQALQATQRAAMQAAAQLQTQQGTSGNSGFGGSGGAALPAKATLQPTTSASTSGSSGNTQPAGAAINDGKLTNAGSTVGSASTATPSANESANKGKSSQNMGQGVNMVAGAGLMAFGAYKEYAGGDGTPYFIMGGLALVQGAMMGGNASDSGKTADATVDCWLPPCNGTPTNPGDPKDPNKPPPGGGDGPKGGFVNKDIKKGLEELKKAGYTITPKGVTGPDGKFTPASTYSTPAGMASAGFSPSTIKDIQAAIGTIQQTTSKIGAGNVAGMALADSGGGNDSGAGGAGSGAEGGALKFPTYKNPFAMGNDDKQKMVAGKTVSFGGDPIGVRGQNIFEMVHSCYEKKRQRSNFIENEGAVMRAPASLPPRPKGPKR